MFRGFFAISSVVRHDGCTIFGPIGDMNEDDAIRWICTADAYADAESHFLAARLV
jgi:hypothetical protein